MCVMVVLVGWGGVVFDGLLLVRTSKRVGIDKTLS